MKSKKIDALWSHVHWLSVLAAAPSFTAAAARLGVSKAAMSYRITELEQAAGDLVGWRDLTLVFEAQQLLVEAPGPVDVVHAEADVVHDAVGQPALLAPCSCSTR